MIREILAVGAGSFAGGALRYIISRMLNAGFPWGTMVVNISGCLLAGIFLAMIEKGGIASHEVRLLLTVGFCGGFTTFSTFMNEGFAMLRTANYLPFSLYIAGSILLGLAAVWLGWWAVRAVWQ